MAACRTRNRPGDSMRDKYNLNTLPDGMREADVDSAMAMGAAAEAASAASAAVPSSVPSMVIPGMAPEDRVAPSFHKVRMCYKSSYLRGLP